MAVTTGTVVGDVEPRAVEDDGRGRKHTTHPAVTVWALLQRWIAEMLAALKMHPTGQTFRFRLGDILPPNRRYFPACELLWPFQVWCCLDILLAVGYTTIGTRLPIGHALVTLAQRRGGDDYAPPVQGNR